MNPIFTLVSLAAIGVGALLGQSKVIDTNRSTITIHVGKAGLFSVAGHEHWVNAPIAEGMVNDSEAPHVDLRVNAAAIEVKPDPKVDAKDQAEIQQNMQEITLESTKYREIVFRSTRVVTQANEKWRVEGVLSLHGTTKPVVFTVERNSGAYVGRTVIKQTDFGIRPISVGGGLVKVKNEVEIEFRIVTRPQ